MDSNNLGGEIGKRILGSENISRIFPDIFEKDAEVLSGLKDLKTPKLTEKIMEHLEGSGRPGSAEYIDVFAKSAILDKELSLLKDGLLSSETADYLGLPLMIDVENTTSEMIENGKAILTENTEKEFLGSINALKYKLDQHIKKTAQKASEYYSNEATRDRTLPEKIKGLLGIETKPYEIPFLPNEEETKKLEELAHLSFTSREGAQRTFQKEFAQMMQRRPGIIGLGNSAELSSFLKNVAETIGGGTEGPVEIENLRKLHTLMSGMGMEELQIYPEFGTEIENRIEQDFSSVVKDTGAPTPEMIKGEVVYTKGEWLTEDIDEKTKAWLMEENLTGVTREFTPEEEETAQSFAEEMFEKAKNAPKGEGNVTPLEALKNLEKNKDDQETLKLLLRIAIRVGTKVTVSVARNLAKDRDTPRDLRIALGVFADLTDEGGKFADKFIAGDSKADLERDCINFIKARVAPEGTNA